MSISKDAAERLIRFMGQHTERESVWQNPSLLLSDKPHYLMSNPTGLVDIICEESVISPEQIDAWLCEEQGVTP